ncbi:MAG: hypothetical protein ACK5WV_15590 [Chryseotalea sp.]|jgi:hypothetical protein
MKKILLILLTLVTVSCDKGRPSSDKHEVASIKDTVDLMKSYPELAELIDKPESTPSDNYFKLIIASDSTCRIEWGNGKFKRETNSDFHFNISRRFRLDWENENFLVLRAGTGTGAWFSLFLPLDSVSQELTIDNTLTKDEHRNLVVAEQFPGTDTIMYILNLSTGKTQYIKDDQKCETFHHLCLDTVMLTKTQLYYKWSTPHKYMDNPKTVERRLEIKI